MPVVCLVLLVVLGLWLPGADAQLPVLAPGAAAMTLDAESLPPPGTTIRCTPEQQVGLMVSTPMALDLQGVTVMDCPIGLVADAPGLPETTAALRQAQPPARITGLTVTGPRCLVGIWLRGSQTVVRGNGAGGCDFGIVVSGTQILLEGNTVTQSRRDGILILGLTNVVRGNHVSQSGGYGIRAAATVPQLGLRTLVFDLSGPAGGNLIEGNVVTGSRFADLRQWPASSTCRGLENMWQGNTVRTTVPRCLQDPPQEEGQGTVK